MSVIPVLKPIAEEEPFDDPLQPLLYSSPQQYPQINNHTISNNSPFYIYRNVLLTCLCSILLGYDIGVLSIAILYINDDLHLSTFDREAIIASMNFAAAFGALISSQIACIFGRRKTIAIASILFFIGSVLMASTESIAIIILSRCILGLGTGAALMIAPVYIAEISPAEIRGRLLTLDEIFINVGILFGFIIGYAIDLTQYSSAIKWKVMVIIGCVPAVVLFCAMFFLPESPRWLIEKGKIEKARSILEQLITDDMLAKDIRSISDSEIIGNKVNNIEIGRKCMNALELDSTIELCTKVSRKTMVDEQIEEILDTIALEKQYMSDFGWKHILCSCIFMRDNENSAYIRYALYITMGVFFFQQASATEAVVYYTPYIFRNIIGIQENMVLLCTVFVGISKLSFIFIATVFLDKCGRRLLLLISAVCLSLCLLMMGICYIFIVGADGEVSNGLMVIAVVLQCLFVASFSIGWGPIMWIVSAEVLPLTIRTRGVALGIAVNRFAGGITVATFITIQLVIDIYGIWFMYFIVSCISVVFVYYWIPETKQQTLEKITQKLIAGDL